MTRSAYLLCCAATLFAASLGGCSLVVDFDRSLLVDAAVDPSPDASLDAGPDAGVDPEPDAN